MSGEKSEDLFYSKSDISNISADDIDQEPKRALSGGQGAQTDSGRDISGKLRLALKEMKDNLDEQSCNEETRGSADVSKQINAIKDGLKEEDLPHLKKGLEEQMLSLKSGLVYVKEYRTKSGRLIKAHYRKRPPRN